MLSVNDLVESLRVLIPTWPGEIRFEDPRPGDQRHMSAEISRAAKDIGWTPEFSLQDGMTPTLRWAAAELAKAEETA